jgi:hypothetical protein
VKGMTMILEAANKYYSTLHEDLHAIKHYIKHNLGVFITLLYLLGSFSGVIYLATLLNHFSVDVFQHIELTDFLLALISHPNLVFTYSCLIVFVAISISIELKRIHNPKKPTFWHKLYHGISYPFYLLNPTYSIITLLFLMLCWYSYIFANVHSEEIQQKKTQSYSISLNDPIQQNQTTLLINVQIVTSTARNLFLYDNKQEKILIIPQHNIAAVIPTIKDESVVKANTARIK